MLSATQRTYAHRCRTGLKNQGQRHKIFTTMSLLYAYKRLGLNEFRKFATKSTRGNIPD